MPFITREDGERFVIPSYRDVLSAKRPTLLKREILLLSSNYGEFITLQRKNTEQYEVAFSPDPGYLLGETVWSYFKRPLDLIYCEAISNTSEALLVIVKSGSVYLDGVFPVDVIPDELVIFRTQAISFDIYIHGNVPISETLEEDKFSLDARSVKSFTVLDQPIFPLLPTQKAFRLQNVNQVLKSRGIGVFPLAPLLIFLGILIALGLLWSFFSSHKEEIPQVIIKATNPYQNYINALLTPDPPQIIQQVVLQTQLLTTIPGWIVDSINYSAIDQQVNVSVKSQGATTHLLFDWAKRHNAKVAVSNDGFHIYLSQSIANRPPPTSINNLNSVIAALVDSIAAVLPGNALSVGALADRGRYAERPIVLTFTQITLARLMIIGQQLKNLPLVLDSVSIKIDQTGYLTGVMNFRVFGN